MKFKSSYIFLALFFSLQTFSQTIPENTIANVRKQIVKKQYKAAEFNLSRYYIKHNNDLETIWLYAQVAHWNSNHSLSEKLFLKAISSDPKNTNLQLDYARSIYENGKLTKAAELIKPLLLIPETQAEALLMDANINFWNGKTKIAKEKVVEFKTLFPNSYLADEISKNIAKATSPYLKTTFEYQSDNQPMKYIAEKVEFGQYKSWLWSPKIDVENYNFTPTEQALTAKLGNGFYLGFLGLSTSFSGGIYHNFSGESDWIGNVDLSKKLNKNITVKAGYNKLPYLGTLLSTTYNLTQSNVFGELDYNNSKLFSVHAAYNHQFYKDENSIKTIAGWILSKPYSYSNFNMQFGYGVNYSNAKTNLFVPKEDIENYTLASNIEGFYNPYFTPKSQLVNSALLLLNYKPSKKLEIGAKGNYGFLAKSDNPFFILNIDVDRNKTITRNFTKTNFNPFEVSSYINYEISPKTLAKLTYTNQQTFFYTRNNVSLALNFKF
jgi:hypothetical protein